MPCWLSFAPLNSSYVDLCSWQAEFVGHNHGVRELAVIPRTDLLISAGFDTEALLWDLSTRLLLMRIAAHRHTLVGNPWPFGLLYALVSPHVTAPCACGK